MHHTSFRHKLYLFRKEGLTLFSLVLLNILALQSVQAQTTYRKRDRNPSQPGINLPHYDNRFWNFGFVVGVNYSTFRVRHSDYFLRQLEGRIAEQRDTIVGITAMGSPGLTAYGLVEARLAEHFNVRFTPGVAFYQRQLRFRHVNDRIEDQLNQSTFAFVELPVMVKFKSLRRGNTRVYMIAGVKPAFEVGAKREETTGFNEVRTNNLDFSIDYGLGLELYYPFFKFAPELRFSHGINDMVNPDPNPYARSIRRLTTHTVSLLFNFE
jgi:hypothetical protein